ncbi:MAG: ATP-binding cassette domain-containing protein [Steroidobacteraceae bacterium]
MPAKARVSRHLAVELAQVDLDRGGRAVLRDIDWKIAPGERWLLFGANGAGKTQLLKLVAGAVWPKPTGRERRRYRFGGEWHHTPQEVLAEIAYLGPERQDRYHRYGWNTTVERIVATGHFRTDILLDPLDATARRAVQAALGKLAIGQLARRRFLTLSFGERRLVLIARALAARPRLLLLDELFTGLDAAYRARVRGWLEGTARARRPWVLSAHRAEDVPRAATHALLLDRGRIAWRGPIARAPLAQWFRRETAPRPATRHQATPARPGRLLVRLAQADVYLDGVQVLQGIEFELRAGECWVVHGGNGSGKTTLLRTLYGDHGVASGGVVERDVIEPGVALEAFRLRVGLVAPHLQTDHPLHLGVAEVVQSGARASIGLNEPASRRERAAAQRVMREFGVSRLAARPLGELSYGQSRRVLFARAAMGRPDLLVLDEPFSGLDPPTRADLMRRLGQRVAAGAAIVLATHHREEWPAFATHELELRRGAVHYRGPRRP